MPVLPRDECAVMPCTGLSSTERAYVIGGASLCGVGVLALAAVFLYRAFNRRAKANAEVRQQMSGVGSPLIAHRASTQSLYNYPSSPMSDTSSHFSTPGSPYSPNPETFHFPILSADGHLLPPPAASTRSSWHSRPSGDLADRPLPATPAEEGLSYGSQNRPSSQFSESTGIVPLLAIQARGSVEILRDDIETSTSQMARPVIQLETFGLHQPQAATYHRSFSAEGEEIRADHVAR